MRSSKSVKKRSCVYLRQYAKTFPWTTTSRKGSSFAFCMKCSRDINLEEVVLEISGDIRKQNYTNTQKKMVWGTASTVLLWANKRGVCNPYRSTLRIFPWRVHLAFQLGDHCTKLFKLMFPDSSIAKDFVILKQQLC